MKFNLKEFLNLNNSSKQQSRPQPASTANAIDVQEKLKNAKYGVFANNPQAQQQFTQSLQVPKFNAITAAVDSFGEAPAKIINQVPKAAKSVVKPFYETADLAKANVQVGLANATGNTQAADNARLSRNQSYQESLVPQISRAYNQVSNVPILGDVINPGNSIKRDVQGRLERELQAQSKQLQDNTQAAAREIRQGVNSGQIDPVQGEAAIQQALAAGDAPNQALDQLYNKQLQDAGFDKNMSKGRMFAQSAGDLASVAGYGIAPISGSQLAGMPLRQAVKTGGTDLAANSILGGGGAAASTYAQGGSLEDSLKAGFQGAGVNALLMGAGLTTNLAKGGPRTLNPSEVSDLQQFRQKAGTPALDDVTYQKGVAAAQKAGIDYRNPTAVDDLLGSALTAQTRAIEQAQRPGVTTKLVDAFKNRQPLGEGGYVSLGAAKKAAPDLAPNQVEFINDYANMIEGMDGNGVTILPDGSRASAKSPPKTDLLDVATAKKNIQEVAKNGRWEGWYGNGDTGYLPMIEKDILANKSVRDAGASLFYDNYKKANNTDIEFDEFMNKDITLYRGGKARTDNIVSYSFDKNMAARHGEVSSITVKPKDTYGMFTTTAEQEVLVPIKSVSAPQVGKTPQVGTKVSYMTSVGEKTGTITKVPDTTQDLRVKGNSYKIKFDEPVQVGMQKPVRESYITWKPGEDGLTVLGDKTIAPQTGKAGFGASEDYRQLPIQGTPLPSKRGQQVTKEQPIQEQASQRPQAPLESSSTPSIPPVANDVSNILRGQEIKERGFSATVRNADKTPKAAAIEAGNYVVKSDKQRVADAREYIKSDPAKAEQLALNPQSDMHVTIGNQLLDNYIATGQLDKFRKLSAGMAESGTELGRAIHAFADYNKTSPSGAVKFAEKTINKYNKANPNNKLSLSDGDIKGLVAKAQEVQAMPEGRARNIASHQLMEQVNNLIPSTVADKAITVWKAGLLTSPRTTMRNLIGNTLHGISETAKDIPAALNDMLLSQKTGDRSLTFTTKGTIKGARKGIMNAKDIMAFGFDPNQAIDKYDVRRVTWDKTPVQQALKTYTDFVFHAMGAQDQPFYEASFARSLYDQAGAAAKNAGKSGDKTFIKNMVDNPTEAMKVAATKDASTATFKNPNQLREVAGKFKTTLGKTEAGKVISEVVAPFTGVPSSIAGQVIQYSPIGLARGVAKNAKVLGGKVTAKELPALQRAASQEIGRGVIGSGLLGVGAYLTAQGLMTGNPKDASEARQWELEGKQANSVMIGGKWRSINSVGPEALVALAGSKIQSAKQNGDGAGKIAADIGKDFTGQTFLAGVQGPLNAISDPARYGGTYAKGQGASIVPNIIKDAAKFGDKYQRETNSVGDAIKAGIPFARDTLLPKRDALGNPLKQEPNGLGAFVDLFNSKTPIKNDVVNELSRLYSVDQSATPSKLQKSQTINGEKKKLSPAELDQLEQATGVPIQQQFKDLIATSSYKNASDELKKKSLDKIVDDVRSQAKTNITSGSNTPITSTSTKSKTTGKLSSAELTLAKDAFSKSDKSYEVVGDKVLRKSADGNVTATPKIKYDYQVGTAQLTQQKNNGDVEGWIKTANGQLESIQKQLKDPSIDPLDAISLQNDAEALQKNIDKYKGYGGFTKPKSGKKGGKGSKGGKGNYASKLNDVYKTNNTAALRNLVKASKITRKRISK